MKIYYLFGCLTCCCLLFFKQATAQDTNITVKGTVKSLDSDESLPGVSIKVRGTSIGTTTDAMGSYTFSVPRKGSLLFSYIGFEPQEVAVKDRCIIDVKMQADIKSLGEVVVVGYTTQSKAKSTAAISKLNSEELKNITNPNPVQAIQGKIAGVSVPITSGQPGAGATNIIIRGGTKLNVYGQGIG